MDATKYELSQGLLQVVVNLLGEMPAARSRHALNAIEAEVQAQEEKRRAQRDAEAALGTIDNWRRQHGAKPEQPPSGEQC